MNTVKSKSMNKAARMKKLFLKLRFDNCLIAKLTISSKKHGMWECPLIEQ